jgi:rhodanese-related sulfurtransferase
MYGVISKYKLEDWLNHKVDLLLIDVLPEEDFAKAHIPGSVNIPFYDDYGFVLEVERSVPKKTSNIVVYCTGFDYTSSKQAARLLENAGFCNTYALENGVESLLPRVVNLY